MPLELTITEVAREFNKTRKTIHEWCQSGFILQLGYTVRRDATGHWFLTPPPSTKPVATQNPPSNSLTTDQELSPL